MLSKTVLPSALDNIQRLLSPTACRDWLLGQLHPAGPVCPTCGQAVDDPRAARRFFAQRAVRCEGCGARFTAFTGTIFSGAQMPLEDIATMLLLFKLGQRDAEIAENLDCNRSTISRWRRVLNDHGAGL